MSIYSESSNYEMLNSSIFNRSESENILEGGEMEDFEPISEFNIDGLFSDSDKNGNTKKTDIVNVDGLFSDASAINFNDMSEIEKMFEDSMKGGCDCGGGNKCNSCKKNEI